ncbi:iron-containing alcohol dehydrogenase [Rhizobium sp. WYJ-E13]|uniref:iron-containing alcohol dehydrogenase n=1 Tax=Rhizobium sp. WYJ-E13 TaxID=2849093 RepID=UPI001C1ED57C|nr:iron-containing alcohol dehydrogenase [Rhizobium sp. WYJ-E13]QWW72610.1 iron-containing alcohol dehydrogenase [Rhizobium sp. WYJ-E13]
MDKLNLLPQKTVLWGKGVVRDIAPRLSDWGLERPVIFSAPALKAAGETSFWPSLAGRVGTMLDLPAHVPESGVAAALRYCIGRDAGSIVAHGGGSVLDAAKAVSYLHHQQTGRYLPIAAVPTTLSGSEFSHYFGITEDRDSEKFKRSYAIVETVPTLVVLDPTMLVDTPRSLLLSSAIKAIDHAVEGMRQVGSDHPHAVLAADGVGRFFSVLGRWPVAIESKRALDAGLISLDDLLQLQLAAWHCYFSPASVVYGLSHRIGHILGGTFGLPHSATSCITLAPVIEACSLFYGDKLGIFLDGERSPDPGALLAKRIGSLVRVLGLADRISAFDIEPDARHRISALLRAHYPKEVADLGTQADDKLDALLERIW